MALMKWGNDGRQTALFATTHKDRTGGGELYAHQIAKQLDGMFDLRYFTGNTGSLHSDFVKYHGTQYRYTSTALMHSTDLFMSCSHFVVPDPYGRHRNAILTFFPNRIHREAVQKYDTVITCSKFSARWVKNYWRKTAKVVYPYVDTTQYEIGEKIPKTIISVGRFFREAHGHSKRQDVLVRAFHRLHSKDRGWLMVLAGSAFNPSDIAYLDYCKDLAKELGVRDRIQFHENVSFDDLHDLYAQSQYYWHGNGYGSTTPYETEHFGIVIAEAMASGCTPVIFENGG